jgi:hypothetical protein
MSITFNIIIKQNSTQGAFFPSNEIKHNNNDGQRPNDERAYITGFDLEMPWTLKVKIKVT